MAYNIRTAFLLARTFSKVLRGRKSSYNILLASHNAFTFAAYLLGRKLGTNKKHFVKFGYREKLHTWEVKRREDLMVLEEVFLDEEYDVSISPPSVIFDLGANFGAASVYFSMKWPKARVFSLEPHPALFQDLLKNTEQYSKITCLQQAAGAEDEMLSFNISNSSVSGRISMAGNGANSILVQARSLKSLMHEFALSRINLLKFDIEGSESLIFKNKDVVCLIDAFVGEVHPELMGCSEEDFVGIFKDFKLTRTETIDGRFILSGVRSPQ